MVGTWTIFRNTPGGRRVLEMFVSVCTFVCLCAAYFKCLNSVPIFTELRTDIMSLEDTSGSVCLSLLQSVITRGGRIKLHWSDTNSTYFDTLEGHMVIHLGKVQSARVEVFPCLGCCAAYFGSFCLLFKTGCIETSVNTYQHMLRNTPKEQRPQIHILHIPLR